MPILTSINALEDIPTFNIVKEEVFDSRGARIPSTFSLMREDSRSHLGICKADYRPIQIDEMLDVVKTACDTIGGITHDGYTLLKDGQRVMIRSIMPEVEGLSNDKMVGHFYTIIDNTGKSANKTIPSSLRLVCDNQMSLLYAEARRNNSDSKSRRGTNGQNIRHSFTFDQKVHAFANNIANNMSMLANFASTAERLRNASFDTDKMLQLTQQLIPSEKNETPQLIRKRETIVDLFTNGTGNEGKTRWDALNAFTEFESKQKFTAAKLLRNLTSNNLSNRALAILNSN